MTESQCIEGVVERIVFLNEETGFTVARFKEDGKNNLTTVVGNLAASMPGEVLRLEGTWEEDRKFGTQFKVMCIDHVMPSTLKGIEKYLGSGLIKGIGHTMAKRLVDKFGLDTITVIEKTPWKLSRINGIGPKRIEMIKKAWSEHQEIKNIMVFLHSLELSPHRAAKIYKKYGDASIQILEENPYCLAEDMVGVGFKTADKIAQKLGISLNSPVRAEAGIMYLLNQMAEEGHTYHPLFEILEKAKLELGIMPAPAEDAIKRLKKKDAIVVERFREEGECVYMKPLHVAEDGVAGFIRQYFNYPAQLPHIKVEEAIKWAESRNRIQLDESQKKALKASLHSPIMVLTGGPGTGKTTLINCIMKIFEAKKLRVLLGAPTGRAAKRLSETTGSEALTIHRLLEYQPSSRSFKRTRKRPLDADIVIIDEVSMVDIVLMYHLLKAIVPPSRLLLVGDIDQLPSVGAGSVLRDIVSAGCVTVVKLTEIFRQAQRSLIILNAHRVNRGEMPSIDKRGDDHDFYFIEKEDPNEIIEVIKKLVSERIPSRFGYANVHDIQVLSPMHKGILGVANLNRVLQELLNPSEREYLFHGVRFRPHDKVMQLRNNYDKDVYNGDIGIISEVDMEGQCVVVTYDGRSVCYELGEMDELTLAYAISIHKSQGSEYKSVIIPLTTQHYIMLQRNLLYTALTRGKELVVIIGSRTALEISVRNDNTEKRFSKLGNRLKKERLL